MPCLPGLASDPGPGMAEPAPAQAVGAVQAVTWQVLGSNQRRRKADRFTDGSLCPLGQPAGIRL